MKMQKLVCAVVSLVFLFSCSDELGNSTTLVSSSSALSDSSSSSAGSISIEPEPSILDCPPEDIAEYPAPSELIPSQANLIGGCGRPIKFSTDRLLFNAQGGVRCLATTGFQGVSESSGMPGCYTELVLESDTVNFTYFNVQRFKRHVCPWFTATKIDDRTVHISLKQNNTEREREARIGISLGNCYNSFLITQTTD